MLRNAIAWFNKKNSNFIMDEVEYGKDKYDNDEHAKLTDIFNNKITKSNYDKQNYTKITKIFTNKTVVTDDDIYIRDIAYRYLESIGLQQNKNHFMIEFWRHRLFGENNKSHIFPKHRDSYGPILAPVNTCIFYLRKDKTFKGSDLEVWGLYGRIASKPIHTFKTNQNIVLFDGGAFHKVMPYSGLGIRDCIVVMFAKT